MEPKITSFYKWLVTNSILNSRSNTYPSPREERAIRVFPAFVRTGRIFLFFMFVTILIAGIPGNIVSAQTLTCKTGCTSNDVQIRSAYLMQDRNGTSLQTCASGTPVQAYLYLDLITNTPRVGVSITANLFNKNTQTLVQAVGECFGQSLSSSGTGITTVIFASPVNWTCGTQIELKDVLIGWGTGGSNFCVGTAAQCPGTSSKCWKQGATTYIPVVTFPCSSPTITSQPANQIKCVGQNATFTSVFTEGDPDQAVIQWKVSSDNGSTWSNVVSGAVYTIANSTVSIGTTKQTTTSISFSNATAALSGSKYKVVLTNNTSTHNCGTESTVAALTVSQQPSAASAGTIQNICGSLTSAGLGGNSPAIGTGTWTKKSGPGSVTFSSANAGNATATVSSVGTYVFTWTISNGTCTETSADITINYYASPTVASLGPGQNICGSLTSGGLGGNDPTVGNGLWTKKSGPGTVSFSNSGAGNATATVGTYGNYIFTWTISNGTCTPSSADVAVNYYATPSTATVGPAQNICGTLVSGALGGNTPAVGAGAWSKKSGPGNVTFSNASAGSSTATVDAVGTYEFTWTISNGTCATKSADVAVTYYATPTNATVGPAQNICGTLVSGALGGNTPAVGAGAWGKKSGPGNVTFSNASAGSSTATVDAVGTYEFTWTISNGTCATKSADVAVTYYATPTTATVGSAQIRCATLVSDALGGNSPVVGTGTWTKKSGPGTVTFSNSSSGSATATVNSIGTYVFTWTITNGTCTPKSADITVSYYAKPTLTAEVTAEPTCADPGTISVTSPTTGFSYSINSTSSYASTSVFSGLSPGTYTIRAKNDVSGCISDEVTLTLQPVAGQPDKPKVEIIDYATPESATGTLMVVNSLTDLPYGNGFEFKNDGYDLTGWVTSPVFTFTAGMGYTILVRRTSDNTCISSTQCQISSGSTSRVAAPTAGVKQPLAKTQVKGMSAYPVPFHGKVTLEFTSDQDESYVINLYDMRGNLVKELKAGTSRAGEITRVEITGSGLSENLYLARKVSKSGVSIVKLLKEN